MEAKLDQAAIPAAVLGQTSGLTHSAESLAAEQHPAHQTASLEANQGGSPPPDPPSAGDGPQEGSPAPGPSGASGLWAEGEFPPLPPMAQGGVELVPPEGQLPPSPGGDPPQPPNGLSPPSAGGPLGSRQPNPASRDLQSPPLPTPPPPQSPQQPRPPRSPASPPPKGQEPKPLSPEQQRQLAEARTIVYNLIPSGRASWWERMARVGEDLAPAAIAIGVGFLAPEALPFLPAIAPEVEVALAESVDAAEAWATLSPNLPEQVANGPPANLRDAIQRFKEAIGRPKLTRADVPEHRLPEQSLDPRREALVQRLIAWAQGLKNTFPDQFTDQVTTASLFGSPKPRASPRPIDIEEHAHHDRHGLPPPPPHTSAKAKRPPPRSVSSPHRNYIPTEADPVLASDADMWVKIGDRSIHSSNLTTILLVDDETAIPKLPTFIRKYIGTMATRVTNFQLVVGGYQVGSPIALPTASGGFDAPAIVWSTALPTHEAPIELGNPQARFDLHVHTGPARELGRFTSSAIAGFFQGGVPSERFITSAIQPNLAIGSLPALKNLTASIESRLEYYDNSLMYAKLWHYVLLHDFFAAIGNAPAAVAFAAGNAPVWIQIDGANQPGLNDIPDAISRGDIILVEGIDVQEDATDLQLIYWLTQPASRFDGAAGQTTPHACYIQWPSIAITVLARRAAPAAPAAAVLTPAGIISFINKLATRRAEWDSSLKGLYAAMDIFGARLIGANNAWRPLRADLSVHNPVLPRVTDYNFMLRLLRIYPACDSSLKDETSAFTACQNTYRLRIVALYAAVLGVASTTLLYDLNVPTAQLSHWQTGNAALSPLFNQVMDETLNFPTPGTPGQEAVFFQQVHAAFTLWLGATVASDLYHEDTWAGDFGSSPNAAHSYGAFPAAITPNQINPLSILEWLEILPFEWGFVAARPTLDIRAEIEFPPVAAQVGWYARGGSILYQERTIGDFPLKIIAYGAQVVNAVCQGLRLAAQPAVNRTVVPWRPFHTGPAAMPFWQAPAAIPVGQLVWIAAIHSFRPCSIMSFDYETNTVMAPALIGDALGAGEAEQLLQFTGQTYTTAGINMPRRGGATAPFVLPARLNMMRIGGHRKRAMAAGDKSTADVDVVAPSALASEAGLVAPPPAANP